MEEFTAKDCIRGMFDETPDKENGNKGMICIIPLANLREDFRKPENQLFKVVSGFGANPECSGRACFGTFCIDGEFCRWNRERFMGVGNDEVQKIGNKMLEEAEKCIK